MGYSNKNWMSTSAIQACKTVLIEKIADAAGVVYEPSRIRRKARAEAESDAKSTAHPNRDEGYCQTNHRGNSQADEHGVSYRKTIPHSEEAAYPTTITTNVHSQSRQTSENEMGSVGKTLKWRG